jgi:SAM-dependent methyltransferase
MTASLWDEPELYELENADDPHFDLPFWTRLLERREARRVLELASGTGRLTFPLAAAGRERDDDFEIVGLERSRPMLAHARAALARQPAPVQSAVRMEEGDMRSFALPQRFDLVIVPFNSLAYIHTREDQLACLEYLAEALHPFPPMRVDADISAPAPGIDRFTRSCVDRYDPSTQTLTSTLYYDVHRRGGAAERQVRDLDWHMYFPAELEGLLAVAGLEPLERRGGWDGEPLDAAARRYVFVCGVD